MPVHIETISGFAVEFPYLKDEFWKTFPKARAKDFAKFLLLAKRGHALDAREPSDPKAKQEYQKGEIVRSIAYCKSIGLGLKA